MRVCEVKPRRGEWCSLSSNPSADLVEWWKMIRAYIHSACLHIYIYPDTRSLVLDLWRHQNPHNEKFKQTNVLTSTLSTPLLIRTYFSLRLSVICLSLPLYWIIFVPVCCRHRPGALSSHRRPLSVYHQLLRERTQQVGLWFTWDTEVMWLSFSPVFLYP